MVVEMLVRQNGHRSSPSPAAVPPNAKRKSFRRGRKMVQLSHKDMVAMV
jgi:hypothetical protein